MRKKMKMQAGGKVKKYAEGGRIEADPPAPVRRRRLNEATASDIGDVAVGAGGIIDRVLSYPLSLVNPVAGTALERAAGRRVRNANESIDRRTQDIDDAARGVRRGARMDMPPRPSDDVDGTGPGASARPARAAASRPARPARARRRTSTRRNEMTADDLNAISLGIAQGSRMGPLAPGAEQNIARAMGYKKGGLVGKKAGPAAVAKKKGGMVGAMKAKTGRPVGRPASGVKPFGTQKMAAALKGRKPVAMPAFKKGGKVSAKGKKK